MFFNRSQPELQAAPTLAKAAGALGASHAGDASLVTPPPPDRGMYGVFRQGHGG